MGRFGALAPAPFVMLGCLLLVSEAAAQDKELNLWPLLYVRESEDGESSELEFLWPLVTSKREGESREWGLHPLFSVSDDGKGTHDVQVLWPLVRYRERERSRNLRAFPLVFHRHEIDYEGGVTRRFFLFPLFFSGATPAAGRYVGFFPLVGRMAGFLGHDEVFFVMFPLYASWKGGDHQGRAVIWPLAGWSQGGGTESFKVLPFFARRKNARGIRTVSVLWPLIHRFGSDDGSVDGFLVFPFYGVLKTPQVTSRVCPWPVHIQTSDAKSEFYAPWPFVKFARGQDLIQVRVWPLFGVTDSAWRDEYFLAWPILIRRVETGEGWEKRFLWTLPFLIRRVDVTETGATSRNLLWPVAKWRSSSAESEMKMLAPVWLPDPERGIERNYEIFWKVFTYRRKGDEREWRVLGRLITGKERPGRGELEIVHLFRYERDGKEKRVRLLKGALGYERDEEGRRLRVLWFLKIPLGGGS